MKPRLLASTNCECCSDTLAPSELRIFFETANAAASQRRAISTASSTARLHGWKRSSSGTSRASSSVSGRPAQSSSAVWRAIAAAASTVCSSAARERSEVLAWPRRAFGRSPKYTETPSERSRLCSMVSGLPLRTVTVRPCASDTSQSQLLAPARLARSRTARARLSSSARSQEKPGCLATGCLFICRAMIPGDGRRNRQQNETQAGDDRAAEARREARRAARVAARGNADGREAARSGARGEAYQEPRREAP